MNKELKIKIAIDNQTQEIKSIKNEFGRLSNTIDDSSKSAKTFQDRIKLMGHSAGGVYLVTQAFSTLSNIYSQTAGRGIEYNKTVEKLKNGLTTLNVVTSSNVTSLGRYISLQEKYTLASKEATEQVKELAKINKETPHSLAQTVEIYKAMYASMKKAGATSKETIELTKKISIAAGSAGIEFQQLLAGVDGLATGTVLSNSELGRFLGTLGLTNEELKKSDDVVKLINDRLKDVQAIKDYDMAMSNLANNIDIKFGELSEPLFDSLKEVLVDLADVIEDIDTNKIVETAKFTAKLTLSITAGAIAYKGYTSAIKIYNALIPTTITRKNALGQVITTTTKKINLQTIATNTLSKAWKTTPFGLVTTAIYLLGDAFLDNSEKSSILEEAYAGVDKNLKNLTKSQLEYRKSLIETQLIQARLDLANAKADASNKSFFESDEEHLKDKANLDEVRKKFNNLGKTNREIKKLLKELDLGATTTTKTVKEHLNANNEKEKDLTKILNIRGTALQKFNLQLDEQIKKLKEAGDTEAEIEKFRKEQTSKFLESQKKKTNSISTVSKKQKEELVTSISDWQVYFEKTGQLQNAWQIQSSEIRKKYVDLNEKEIKELLKIEKKEYFDRFKKTSKDTFEESARHSLKYFETVRDYTKSWNTQEQILRKQHKDLLEDLTQEEVANFLAAQEKKYSSSFYSYENLKSQEDGYKHFLISLEQKTKTSGQVFVDTMQGASSDITNAWGNFFDFTSSSFLKLENLAINVGQSILKNLIQQQFVQPLAGATTSVVGDVVKSVTGEKTVGASLLSGASSIWSTAKDLFSSDTGGKSTFSTVKDFLFDKGGKVLKTSEGYTYGGIRKIAGVTHGGEYVAPHYQVKQYKSLFNWLDSQRTGKGVAGAETIAGLIGFSTGGYSSRDKDFDYNDTTEADFNSSFDDDFSSKASGHSKGMEGTFSKDSDRDSYTNKYNEKVTEFYNGIKEIVGKNYGYKYNKDGLISSWSTSVTDGKRITTDYSSNLLGNTTNVFTTDNKTGQILNHETLKDILGVSFSSDTHYNKTNSSASFFTEQIADLFDHFGEKLAPSTIGTMSLVEDVASFALGGVKNIPKALAMLNAPKAYSMGGLMNAVGGLQLANYTGKGIGLVNRAGKEAGLKEDLINLAGLKNTSKALFDFGENIQKIEKDLSSKDSGKKLTLASKEFGEEFGKARENINLALKEDSFNIIKDVQKKYLRNVDENLDKYKDSWSKILGQHLEGGEAKILDDVLKVSSPETYKIWEKYAKKQKTDVEKALASAISTIDKTKDSFTQYLLKDDPVALAQHKAKQNKKAFESIASSMGVDFATLTKDNFLSKYDEAVKNSFDPNTISNWDRLGEALKNSTNAQEQYTKAQEQHAQSVLRATQNAYNAQISFMNALGRDTSKLSIENEKLQIFNWVLTNTNKGEEYKNNLKDKGQDWAIEQWKNSLTDLADGNSNWGENLFDYAKGNENRTEFINKITKLITMENQIAQANKANNSYQPINNSSYKSVSLFTGELDKLIKKFSEGSSYLKQTYNTSKNVIDNIFKDNKEYQNAQYRHYINEAKKYNALVKTDPFNIANTKALFENTKEASSHVQGYLNKDNFANAFDYKFNQLKVANTFQGFKNTSSVHEKLDEVAKLLREIKSNATTQNQISEATKFATEKSAEILEDMLENEEETIRKEVINELRAGA